MNGVFISQRMAFFIITAVKTSTLKAGNSSYILEDEKSSLVVFAEKKWDLRTWNPMFVLYFSLQLERLESRPIFEPWIPKKKN
jgi:hypothetical protein